MHAARLGAGTAAVIAVLGLSGCAFNPLSTFTTPTIDQIEYETVTSAVSDDALVTPGTLTVALDTSDAPQAMQALTASSRVCSRRCPRPRKPHGP